MLITRWFNQLLGVKMGKKLQCVEPIMLMGKDAMEEMGEEKLETDIEDGVEEEVAEVSLRKVDNDLAMEEEPCYRAFQKKWTF